MNHKLIITIEYSDNDSLNSALDDINDDFTNGSVGLLYGGESFGTIRNTFTTDIKLIK